MSMNSRNITFTDMDLTANATTDEFPVRGGDALTIHHSAAGSTPTGVWHLQVYNPASSAWETFADGDAEFTNPAAGDASGSANFTNPPIGRCRVLYTYTSLGSATGGNVTVEIA